MSKKITFRQLDQNTPLSKPACALEAWYSKVRDTPLHDLTVTDLARAIRQDTFHNAVVPIAIQILLKDPWSGGLYDGELLIALDSVPDDFWHKRFDLRNQLHQVFTLFDEQSAQSTQEQSTLEPEIRNSGLDENSLAQIRLFRAKLAKYKTP